MSLRVGGVYDFKTHSGRCGRATVLSLENEVNPHLNIKTKWVDAHGVHYESFNRAEFATIKEVQA